MKGAVAFTYLHTPTVQPRNNRWVRRAPAINARALLVSLPRQRRLDRTQRCFFSLRDATDVGRPRPKPAATTAAAATTTAVTSMSKDSPGHGANRFVEGERRLRRLLGSGKWRDVNIVLQSLREEGYHVNLRAYRACMEIMAENERGNEALGYLQEMKAEGVVADDVTLGHAATACARGGDLDDALIILRAMAAKGMAVARTYNMALVAIAHGKTGPSRPTTVIPGRKRRKGDRGNRATTLTSTECNNAIALVDEMRVAGAMPNGLTYNVLISALAKAGRPETEVLGLLDQMREEQLSPDSYTFVAVIRALKGADGAYDRVRQLLEDAKMSLHGPVLARVYAVAISACSPEARWAEAEELVEEMREVGLPRDEYTYCSILNVYKQAGKWERGVDLLRQMKEDGVPPTQVAYNTVIGACAFFGRPSRLPNGDARRRGRSRQQSKERVLTRTQQETIRAGDVALGLLDEMIQTGIEPDVITYGSLMSALSPRGEKGADEVLKVFDSLLANGVRPNTITYVSAIRAWGDKGDWKQAEKSLTEMKEVHGLAPNRYCYSAVIKALSNGGQWRRALDKLEEMRMMGMNPDHVVYTATIVACEKDGQWEEALRVLAKLIATNPAKHALLWAYNATISALGKAQQLDGVKDLVDKMKASGVEPDQYTYACLMRAVGISGDWEEALLLLNEMESAGVVANAVVYNTLISSLAKAEEHEEATELLNRMRARGVPPDVMTYTALISGNKRTADWVQAESVLSEMLTYGVQPNCRTCTAMLKIYTSAMEVERALAFFETWCDQCVEMDTYCFNAVMGAALKGGLTAKVSELYSLLEARGLEPDDITLSVLLNAADEAGDTAWAHAVIEGLRTTGRVPSVQVYADAIRACSTSERVSSPGLETVGEEGTGVGEAALLGNVEGVRPLRRAMDVFAEARTHHPGDGGGRLYTSMLVACARDGRQAGADIARDLLAEMKSLSVPMEYSSYAPAASALAVGGYWEGAIEILQDGAETGFSPGDRLCEQIRKGADAVGQLDVARRLLDGVSTNADTPATSPSVNAAAEGDLPRAAAAAAAAAEETPASPAS